ncbi:peptidase M19 renal dipeptidase [Sulfobacillus acidophilus TPY]|uniref:Peptidase M19 renal dipeptidase n=1 Tax=Sulfobacillus acidophilus (strain ATCC 700253 / DSM 10332 / NAL) TaxID=679936 RepID=G8TTF4_SULAD|nr:peptidase M19 renal dipeptidase [Sulfobacillus acidophilus TPY]AEW04534.1 peptidase M19 renal dipeptidase [Sulfobacillus acidophilus DSM 10332]
MFPIPVFDCHSDIPADIARRRAEGERRVFARHYWSRLSQAGVVGSLFALWVEPPYRQNSAHRVLQLASALWADIQESPELIRIVTDDEPLNPTDPRFQVVLGLEGMTFVEQWLLDRNDHPVSLWEGYQESFTVLRRLGVRHAMLAWAETNALASGPDVFPKSHSAHRPPGLTPLGRDIVRHLAGAGILLDISHLDDTSAADVCDSHSGLLIASHSNARALSDHPRNLPDFLIKTIGDRHGIIGLNSYGPYVDKDHPTMDRLIDHLIYIANLIGIRHVAFGFDFTDYLPTIYHASRPTEGLSRVEDVPQFLDRLSQRGFSDDEIRAVSFGNIQRVWDRQQQSMQGG